MLRAQPRVLIVEDNPSLRQLLERMLSPKARVSTVESGQQALAWLGRGLQVDLVLCDLNLGDMSALNLLELLLERGECWRGRFMICTGGEVCPKQSRALQGSGIPVLRKPFRAEKLCRTVASVLQAREGLISQSDPSAGPP